MGGWWPLWGHHPFRSSWDNRMHHTFSCVERRRLPPSLTHPEFVGLSGWKARPPLLPPATECVVVFLAFGGRASKRLLAALPHRPLVGEKGSQVAEKPDPPPPPGPSGVPAAFRKVPLGIWPSKESEEEGDGEEGEGGHTASSWRNSSGAQYSRVPVQPVRPAGRRAVTCIDSPRSVGRGGGEWAPPPGGGSSAGRGPDAWAHGRKRPQRSTIGESSERAFGRCGPHPPSPPRLAVL